MKALLPFDSQHVTDQKRLARGEQLLAARSHLRVRDGKHNAAWRVMMLAGGAPSGEIKAIRELMPKAVITAVDSDARCLELAIEAGADEVIHCDLTEWSKTPSGNRRANEKILAAGHFDLIHMDLCAGVNETTKRIVLTYRDCLTTRGAMIVAFSYGRDVQELFKHAIEQEKTWSESDRLADEVRTAAIERIQEGNIPEAIVGRILYLFTTKTWLCNLSSVVAYKGAQMPMCSCLFAFGNGKPRGTVSFVKLEPGDFELAVVYPDAAHLYDCPQERIEALRRKFAAIKASLTRQQTLKEFL